MRFCSRCSSPWSGWTLGLETIVEYGVAIVVTRGLRTIVALIGGLVLTRVISEMDWVHAAGGITGGYIDTNELAAAIDATGARDRCGIREHLLACSFRNSDYVTVLVD